MNNYLIYIFEANITLLVCGLFYFLVLQKETDFKMKRIYLLASSLFALIVPLLHFNLIFGSGEGNTIRDIQTMVLPEIVIGTGEIQEIESTEALQNWWVYGYWSIVVLLGAWLMFQLGQVVWFYLANHRRSVKQEKHTLIYTNGTLPTFSFFRLLFLDNSVQLSNEDEDRIIAHEVAHIRQWHSADIIFLDLLKIFFWFNPVTWFYRNEIQDLHEYLADREILRETTPEDYSSLLAKMALNKAHLSIGHHFNKSKTLKRINMMKTTKTKIKRWKLASLLPLVTVILIVFACNDESMNEINHVMDETAMAAEVPEDIKLEMAELQKQNPDAEFVYLETPLDNEERVAKLKNIDPKTIASMHVMKEDNRLGMIVRVNGVMESVQSKTMDGEVFTIVEEPAQPQGGMAGFFSYIAENLTYPAQARKAGVQGKVYIQFVVDKDGSITDVQTVKGIGAGCDAEAARVIAEAPAWTPAQQRGKIVKQKIVVPIVFALDDDETGSSESGAIEIERVNEKMRLESSIDGLMMKGRLFGENEKPLPGVNVVIAGTNKGTVSDIDGSFAITLDNKDQEVVFSFIGYETVKKSLR